MFFLKTEPRKGEHVKIVLEKDVDHSYPTGLEGIRFLHYALPELDYNEVSTEAVFLGKKLNAPFLVTGMTGGYAEAVKINQDIARACEQEGIAFAVGSQRAMIEKPELLSTYNVRDVAPNVFLAGNIGGFQVKKYSVKQIQQMVDAIQADALCVHLNPAQEMAQPEGDVDWSGVLEAVTKLCGELSVPVIAKEVGHGINGVVAKELVKAGVKAIDVSGAGGTSWVAVEHHRGGNSGEVFWDWGVPTAEALQQCSKAVKVPLIASGGVRSGLDVAKAVRLGATLGGAASPFIKAQNRSGWTEVVEYIKKWKRELKTAMLLTRSKDLFELRKAELLE